MPTTSGLILPYPDASDVPDIPGDIQALAEQLDDVVVPVPVGAVMPFAGAAAPTRFLLCDGASLLRAPYPDLFTAIGVAYGAVDGTHFNLPDLKGRAPVGAGTGAGLTARALAAKAGVEPATMPNHAHGGGNHSHPAAAAAGYWADYGGGFPATVAGGATHRMQNGAGIVNSGNIITAEGSGDNMQPFIVLNFIIRAQ